MSQVEGCSSTPTRNGIDVSPNGVVSPTRVSATLSLLRPFIPRFVLSVLNMPRSLWRVLSLQDLPPDTQLSLPPTHRLSTNSLTSLTPSRPAPPSPVVSRRASGLSRTSSRPVSGASSRPPSGIQHPRPISGTLQPSTPTPMITGTSPPATPRPSTHLTPTTPEPTTAKLAPPTPTTVATTSAFIQIRDYGFAQTDPRFTGQGPNVPRANRPTFLARRLASTSRSTRTSSSEGDNSDDDYEDEEDDKGLGERMNIDGDQGVWQDEDDGVNGWPGLQWGLGRAWGFRPASGGTGFPSRGDLDRNFGGEDEHEDMEIDDALSDEEVHDAESELPLFPGIYRALYAFEPEGTAEMKLDEDQFVRVIGRGGGVGWAVVVKDGLKDAGVHALVPESYLEPVRLDGEEDLEC